MPSVVVERARAKVNVALHVLGRRADGYHELDSIVAFADYGDSLVLEPAAVTSLAVNGPFASDVPTDESNLVLKAHALLSSHVACPPVRFVLEKNLPVASGIGGGSTDAAAALRGLLRLMGASLAPSQLTMLALQLGADLPVCLEGRSVRMRGVGETLTPLANPVAAAIVLANPRVPCATSAVFKAMGLKNGETYRSGLDPDAPALWRNDMTEAAISAVPVIADVLIALGKAEGLHSVRMSGSGATCFGLADSLEAAQTAAKHLQTRHPDWWIVSAAIV